MKQTDIIDWRRHFHRYPELSGEEKETASFIAGLLRDFGLPVQERVGGEYGLVALIEGDPRYRCAALRADMDALPVTEVSDCVYKSQAPGVTHACGHDAHMAMVLGAARALAVSPPRGSVKLVFQPHEERKPGGARAMIEAGVLENPGVDGLFATHVNNSFPLGSIAVSDGAMMAASDDFDLVIVGQSGHGAIPHMAVDPIAIAAQVITAYHEIVPRRIDPVDPAVLSICSVNSGDTYNVIPNDVVLRGTVRCFDLAVRERIKAEMARVAAGICSAWRAEARLDYYPGYPPLLNDPKMAAIVRRATAGVPGAGAVLVPKPPMAGEDFAVFGQYRPIAFFFTGTGSERCQRRWHDYAFDIEEEALILGAKVFAAAAADLANQKK